MHALLTTLCLLAPQDPTPAPQPQSNAPLDHTGIAWALPFDRARAAGRQNRRLLLIKPIAFGTDAAGGW